MHKLHLDNNYVTYSHINCAHAVPKFLIGDECSSVKGIGTLKSLLHTLKRNVNDAGYLLKGPHLELHCLYENGVPKAA